MKEKCIRFIATKEAAIAYIGAPFTNRLIEQYAKQGVKQMTLRGFGQKASHKYGSEEDNKKLGREARMMPQGINLKFSVTIYDDVVGFFAPLSENYGFIIKDKDFAHLMAVFFDQMWQISEITEDQQLGQLAKQRDTDDARYISHEKTWK